MAAAEGQSIPEFLRDARELVQAGEPLRALACLKRGAKPSASFSQQIQYARIGKMIATQLSGLQRIRIAFLTNSTLDHWIECLRFWLLLEGYQLDEKLIPIGTWRQSIADHSSDLYSSSIDIAWFFLRKEDLHLSSAPSIDKEAANCAVEAAIVDLQNCVKTLVSRLPVLCIVNNLEMPAHRIFGNFEATNSASAASKINRFNLALPDNVPVGTAIFDICHLSAQFGLDRWEDGRLWHHSKHPFSLDAHGAVAFSGARVVAASRGRARKCLVVDLDNTLWGGVIGDDGLDGIRVGPNGGAAGEAFARFQTWLKYLSERGIALAVCSKNSDETAREPFLRKEGMVLELNDFAAFKANWNDKVQNIKTIAKELNIGLESIVFVDDNPAERELVRQELLEVGVPEMPADPSNFISALDEGRWFETLSITQEDLIRARAYRDNGARARELASTTDLEAYLSGLGMSSTWAPVNEATVQRATQLINKTNQFHLTNTRYTEAQIRAFMSSKSTWVGQFSLSDRFGHHGIVSAVIVHFNGDEAAIDTWVMSCRVFSRQMEDFVFRVVWGIAKERGCTYLRGRYVETPRNGYVTDLYKRLGGTKDGSGPTGEVWRFSLRGSEPSGSRHIADATE